MSCARWFCGFLSLFFVSGVSACGGLRVRGGESQRRGEGEGVVLASYRATRCVDARGGSVPSSGLERYSLVVTPQGEKRLLLSRAGQESWWIALAFEESGELVFQLSLEEGSTAPLLRDVRLQGKVGRTAWVRRWSEERREDGTIRAYFERAQLSCALEDRE